jgi:perosamine synthetase
MVHIPVYEPFLEGNERNYVRECMETNWISSRGRFVSEFERSFEAYCGLTHCTSVANGTVALHLALCALGIAHGDEVIVPTLTYIAPVNMISLVGATPVFVDSLPNTLQADPDEIQRKITPRTKAVLVVHLYGHPCAMDQICQICEENNLFLIEDCAEAFGASYRGQHVGSFGHVATFSFFGNKTITTGEGGMVTCKDKDIYELCCHLKSQAVSVDKAYWHDMLGFNYRMTNIQAAIGLAQLEQADRILSRKREIADHYIRSLQGLPLRFHVPFGPVEHSFWMSSIILEDPSQRDPLRDFLFKRGIETRPFFYPAHVMPVHHRSEAYPNAESLSSRGINLPSHPGLTDDQLNYITESVHDYFSTQRWE